MEEYNGILTISYLEIADKISDAIFRMAIPEWAAGHSFAYNGVDLQTYNAALGISKEMRKIFDKLYEAYINGETDHKAMAEWFMKIEMTPMEISVCVELLEKDKGDFREIFSKAGLDPNCHHNFFPKS